MLTCAHSDDVSECQVPEGHYGMLFLDGHRHDGEGDDDDDHHEMVDLWTGKGGTKIAAIPHPIDGKMLDSCRFSIVLRVTYKLHPAPTMVPRLAPHPGNPELRRNRVCSEASVTTLFPSTLRVLFLSLLFTKFKCIDH